MLKQYKAQSRVETSFKFLKDPLFVGSVILKKPSRVLVLAYVLLMALLMFGLLERRGKEAGNNKHLIFIENLPYAIVYHRIVIDDNGDSVDYVFLEVNAAFEEMTG